MRHILNNMPPVGFVVIVIIALLFVLSVVLLIATFVLCAWASAKIYRVGILMFGKKSTWKDLWKWLKQD